MSFLLWLTGLSVLALAVSPALRRALFQRVLFPAGYFLYTQQIPGYTLHQARFMSSPTKVKVPHTKIDKVTEDGEGALAIQVVPIPVLDDNYAYLVLHPASRTAALVDPADPYPILKVLQEQYPEYTLKTILTTHKHCQLLSSAACVHTCC
jgi:hypothetical protein